MLFSELYKIMVNQVAFAGFRGKVTPTAPWIRPGQQVESQWADIFAGSNIYGDNVSLCLTTNHVFEIFMAAVALPSLRPCQQASWYTITNQDKISAKKLS